MHFDWLVVVVVGVVGVVVDGSGPCTGLSRVLQIGYPRSGCTYD
jgi:hypothetical protein